MKAINPILLPTNSKIMVRIIAPRKKVYLANVINSKKVVQLWKKLPPGVGRRCFTPVYKIAFYKDEQELFIAPVCWSCHRIRALGNVECDKYEFDAEATVSQELLALVKKIASNYDESSEGY